MKRRVFARRRHAETKARLRLRLCAWVGVPAAIAVIGLDAHAPINLAAAGTAALAVVAIAYSIAVLRLHDRSEEHTSELQSLMRISYAVFCLKKTNTKAKFDSSLD